MCAAEQDELNVYQSAEARFEIAAQKLALEDGTIVKGETNISRSRKRIERVRLCPRRARPLAEVLQALRQADLILVGPGSLYTSLIPNLLIDEVVDVITHSRARCVYIANLMTQPGETQHYSVADHVQAIYQHTRRRIFDSVVLNRTAVPPGLLRRYRAQGSEPVRASLQELHQMGLNVITGCLLYTSPSPRDSTSSRMPSSA